MLRWSDTGEDMLEMIANEMPDARRVQLLRSAIGPSFEHHRDTQQRFFGLAEMRMQSGECDRGLWPACSVLRPIEDMGIKGNQSGQAPRKVASEPGPFSPL